jgi:hypothetical protein
MRKSGIRLLTVSMLLISSLLLLSQKSPPSSKTVSLQLPAEKMSPAEAQTLRIAEMNTRQLRELIIEPTLKDLKLYSESAVNLLLGTAAQESLMGEYIHQVGGGPAKGIFQMEPATETDIWTHYLKYKPELADRVAALMTPHDIGGGNLVGNLYYATAMARIHYLRKKESLPHHQDVEGMARYWKIHYNTIHGKGTVEEFIHNYQKHVLG